MRNMKISKALEKATVEKINDYEDERPDSYRVTLKNGDAELTFDVEAKDKKDAIKQVTESVKAQPLLPDGFVFDNGEQHQTIE